MAYFSLQKKDKMSDINEVESFYDGFSKRQNKIGINIRHYTIANKLIESGLKSSSSLLEAGCGVGTITQLLARKIKKGSITAFDISSEGVEITKSRVKHQANINILKSDLLGFNSDKLFDFILFADVLEHISAEELGPSIHHLLKFAKPDSKIVINIPDPAMNDYLRINHPEKLQIIDNSVYAEDIMKVFNGTGYKLVQFDRYSLHHEEADYNFMIMQQRPSYSNMQDKKALSIMFAKAIQRFKYYMF